MVVEGKEKDLLTNEIRSWDKFKYALRGQNATTLFDQMLKECQKEEKKDDKEQSTIR
ncbi:MAG: hypothetical protein JO297_10595 [Nitrososphaeraceae archaeon]|nr:hypothetical protein [Nitrososphaeraceae archaeon]